MRLPGEEETREKMRLSVCRKWLLAAAAAVSVNSNKKLMSDCHRWLFLLSPFSKWSGQFEAANVYACEGSALLSKGGIPSVFCFT